MKEKEKIKEKVLKEFLKEMQVDKFPINLKERRLIIQAINKTIQELQKEFDEKDCKINRLNYKLNGIYEIIKQTKKENQDLKNKLKEKV